LCAKVKEKAKKTNKHIKTTKSEEEKKKEIPVHGNLMILLSVPLVMLLSPYKKKTFNKKPFVFFPFHSKAFAVTL